MSSKAFFRGLHRILYRGVQQSDQDFSNEIGHDDYSEAVASRGLERMDRLLFPSQRRLLDYEWRTQEYSL